MEEAKLVAASAIALAVTLFSIFSMRPLARRLGLVDKPDPRKRHRGRVPLIGGLCFFLGTIAGLLYLGYIDRFVASLLVPCALIVMTGAVDDLHNLSVRARLVIQTCAAALVIAASGVYLDHTGPIFGGVGLDLGLAGIPITIIAVIGLINAFNMLDGIDGLAASLAMVSIGAIMLFANVDWPTLGVMLMLQVLFASLIPYLFVNMGWPDGRKIFMGDAGSTLIGFLLAWSLVFLSHRGVERLAPVDALWCVALPVMDTLAVMYRRVRKGHSPFKPDRQHLHHLLQDAGCSARVTLATIVVAGGALAMTGYGLRDAPEVASVAVFAGILVAYVLYFARVLARISAGLGDRRDTASTVEVSPELSTISGPSAAMLPREGVIKALCVMATPPDAIRIAPIARQLLNDIRFDARVCVAAQSDQTPAQVLSLFGMQPDMQLRVAARPGQPDDITSMTLAGMKRVLGQFKPDVVLVSSDASTTLATTLAAFYQQIPIVCIERGGSLSTSAANHMDESSRKITSTLASLHFTHSASAGRQLLEDGVPSDRIVISGNTAVGTLRKAAERIRRDPELRSELAQCFAFLRTGSPLLLVTDSDSMQFTHGECSDAGCGDNGANDAVGHAPGDTELMCHALRKIAMRRPNVDIVYTISGSGTASTNLDALLRSCPNLHLAAPTDYLSFTYLLDLANLVLADSDDLASEVASLGKQVLLVQQGGASGHSSNIGISRVGAQEHEIVSGALGLLEHSRRIEIAAAPDSNARRDPCERIVDMLAAFRHATAIPAGARSMSGLQLHPVAEAMREAS